MEAVILIVGALADRARLLVGTQYQRKQSATVLGLAEHQARALLDDARRQAETTAARPPWRPRRRSPAAAPGRRGRGVKA